MWNSVKAACCGATEDGSTSRLLQLCGGYFGLYVVTGVLVKYFTGPAGMNETAYTLYSTWGGSLLCVAVALSLGWHRLKTAGTRRIFGLDVPAEYLYIIPSGFCTAVVIPTTTLMYLLPISVMVAMVIMRASIIVISRLVDAVQIRQGILRKKVYPEENIAMALALCAVAVQLSGAKCGDFNFVKNIPALCILSCYIAAYAVRIYIMNYYKNTRPPGTPQDNKGFFAIEQIAAIAVMAVATAWLLASPAEAGSAVSQFQTGLRNPHPLWKQAMAAGMVYGVSAFFSVFLFMFKGRTATFAGLVNRLTSLVAGTAATLLTWRFFGGKFPSAQDWAGLLVMAAAIRYLSLAEKKRTAELSL
ncbi:MAG: hypothetical protein WC421_10800 [Elusimicrobiales bacterium]